MLGGVDGQKRMQGREKYGIYSKARRKQLSHHRVPQVQLSGQPSQVGTENGTSARWIDAQADREMAERAGCFV